MPELFVNLPSFVACFLIMAAGQMIYATIGFGAGMFSVALMALVLPDLTGIVVVLLMLTFVTELWVLACTWRQAKIRLLGWLIPGMVAGLWLGTRVLVTTDVSILKRLLGLVVAGAGLYFVITHWAQQSAQKRAENERPRSLSVPWISFPVGLFSGFLGGMFGAGGPPVIILFRAHGLDKANFRSTILTYFLLMSLVRAGTYTEVDLVTADRAIAAAWLLPGSVAGIVAGMAIHDRISERQFGQLVSLLLVGLGALLVAGVGR